MKAITRLSHAILLAGLASVIVAAVPASAADDSAAECQSQDTERRIAGCTDLLLQPGLHPEAAAAAYSLRALAYQVKGLNEAALRDYDRSLALSPNSPVALNNRAWALVKSGRPLDGVNDVERSLLLEPRNADAHDTRGHIRQSQGRLDDALADYEAAIRFGGARMVKLYQCGLQSQGLYEGEVDGVVTAPLREALSKCVLGGKCDPLPRQVPFAFN